MTDELKACLIRRARDIALEYCEPNSLIDSGNLHWALGVCLAEIDRLNTRAATTEWKPIESAPMDGKTILGAKNYYSEPRTTWWSLEHKRWMTLDQKPRTDDYQTFDVHLISWWPILWLPIPKAPTPPPTRSGSREG